MDQNVIERQTYSFLEWLGDIGGLYDALRLIGLLMMSPFSSFFLKAELLSQVFRFTESKQYAEKRERELEAAKKGKPRPPDESPRPPGGIQGDQNLAENMYWDF